MSSVVIVGSQWGDEGKGKMVDYYAGLADAVVRYQGGSNAGHTLVIDGKKIVMHLIPAGILREKPLCILADNVVIEPNTLLSEIGMLKDAGCNISPSRFKISARAHVTMPYHIMVDHLREIKRARAKIGTTGRGIGPTYEDKAARRGIRVGDLLHPEVLKERLEIILDDRNYYIKNYLEETPFAFDKLFDEALKFGEQLAPYIDDTSLLLWNMCRENKNILFEGAQGIMLDLNGGTYPYVTSSNTTPAAAAVSAGVSPAFLKNIVGVAKAYTTRVGEGPMPTELNCEVGDLLRFQGGEYGATTGRPRRCGWLDMVALRYAIRYAGITSLILTKIDILSGFPEIKVAVAYEINGKRYDEFPYDISVLYEAKPIYEILPGWKEDIKGASSLDELPENARNYVNWIVERAGIPLVMLSVGAQRGESIEAYNPFKA
ncbi:MAG: adenylosuccinate synthase [Oligoflexia bacterium]|nr:adenylosuccinate synthase [Oligoflexia bacterium]